MSNEAIAESRTLVTADDFHVPAHGDLFEAICAERDTGGSVDPAVVTDRLGRAGKDRDRVASALTAIMATTPSAANTPRYARVVVEHATLRRLIGIAADISQAAFDQPDDVPELVDRAKGWLAEVEIPGTAPGGVWSLDDFIAVDEDPYDWVIPDLLEKGDRVILVAPEGYGKTMLYRQFAILAGQGQHPLNNQPMRPVRSLLVDLENPERIVRRTTRAIIGTAQRNRGDSYVPDRAWLWHQPAGINLRTRAGVAALDSVLRETRPELVCMGPLYKAFRAKSGEDDEKVAGEVTAALDDLRVRHGFALMLEHHAPKGAHGARDMVPFGSSVWMRWPEFGPALTPEKAGKRDVLMWGDWRGPRDIRRWPTKISRGAAWPWDATFEGKAA